MRFLILVCITTFCFSLQAQEVEVDGITYKIKGESVFKDGVDISETITVEEKTEIKNILESKLRLEKEEKEREAKIKKAEKEQRKAENKQKSAEKALKKKEKAHAYFEKAGKKHKDAVSKYEKLKKKGKLSPEDERKWLEKIDSHKKDLDKAKKRM